QVSQIYDQELAGVDLSLNEYSILRHTENDPRLVGELAESLGMQRTTLTRNLKPLLDAGWLKESRGKEDARQRFIAITASGRKRLVSAKPHWQRAQRRMEGSFGVARVKRLREDLDLLDAVLRGQPGVSA
ncbi:MAG: MarR family winged helix-turn-helix transcriptional regulator, partial [Pseudoxanthomonas sp.]